MCVFHILVLYSWLKSELKYRRRCWQWWTTTIVRVILGARWSICEELNKAVCRCSTSACTEQSGMFSHWAEVTVLEKCRLLQKQVNNIQTVLGNGWCRLQNAGGKLVFLSPTPLPSENVTYPSIHNLCIYDDRNGRWTDSCFSSSGLLRVYFSAWFLFSKFLGAKFAFSF